MDGELENSSPFPVQSALTPTLHPVDKRSQLKSSCPTKSQLKKCSHKVYNPFFGCYMSPIPCKASPEKSSVASPPDTSIPQAEIQKDIITSINEIFECPMDLKVTIHIPPIYTTRKRWTLQQELELLRLSKQYNMDWQLISQSWFSSCKSCVDFSSHFSPTECHTYFNTYLIQSINLGYWSKREVLQLLEASQSKKTHSDLSKCLKDHDQFQISSMIDILKAVEL